VRRLAILGVLGALAAAGSGVGLSSAAFTAHAEFTGSVTTASDWLAPSLSLTSPADDSFQKSTTVTLSGAAGNASGDDSTVTVNIWPGSSASGAPVTTRTVTRSGATWSTSITGMAPGTYTAQATQSDSSDNTATSAASTFTIDTTAPARASVGAANGNGTAGHLDAGDTITFTYSERMLPSSILSSWSATTSASVKVRFFSSTGGDSFTVLDSNSAANVKLDNGTTGGGGVSLGTSANYVMATTTFAATLGQSSDGKSFVVTLVGSPDYPSRVVSTPVTAKNMTWSPKAGPTDLAGNALASTASWTESDFDRDF
jgi:chitinase